MFFMYFENLLCYYNGNDTASLRECKEFYGRFTYN